jgi:hypothetical protein
LFHYLVRVDHFLVLVAVLHRWEHGPAVDEDLVCLSTAVLRELQLLNKMFYLDHEVDEEKDEDNYKDHRERLQNDSVVVVIKDDRKDCIAEENYTERDAHLPIN